MSDKVLLPPVQAICISQPSDCQVLFPWGPHMDRLSWKRYTRSKVSKGQKIKIITKSASFSAHNVILLRWLHPVLKSLSWETEAQRRGTWLSIILCPCREGLLSPFHMHEDLVIWKFSPNLIAEYVTYINPEPAQISISWSWKSRITERTTWIT